MPFLKPIGKDQFKYSMNTNLQDKKEIRIAVPTNDGKTIFEGMLGRANNFFIFEIDSNKLNLVDKRTNPYAMTMQPQKALDVYELFSDCAIVLSAKIGKKGIERLKRRNLHLIFKKGIIRDGLVELLQKDVEWRKMVNKA